MIKHYNKHDPPSSYHNLQVVVRRKHTIFCVILRKANKTHTNLFYVGFRFKTQSWRTLFPTGPETFQPPRRRYCDVSEERQTTRVFLLEFHTIRLAAQQPKRRQTYFSTKTPTSVLDRSGILLSKTLLECSRPARLLTVRSGVRSATYTPRLHRCRVQSAP